MVEQLNLGFDNLRYQVNSSQFLKRHTSKYILNGISGEFRCNELTAIIGISGSGKSSLLDILSGFRKPHKTLTGTETKITGSIKINGKDDSFRNSATYIMQENKLHEYLTVKETMMFAENFKRTKRDQQKRCSSENILKSLNMCDKRGTLVKHLSGGEKKRLTIAIELVDDPAILFVDEPTTGLDSSSSTQCMQILKKLAQEGRTVICTIHTPSSSIFKMFDHIYALANGNCIYQGSVGNLVPFLSSLNLVCPANYSALDFLLEVATNEYGEQNHLLTDKIQNGSNFEFRQESSKLTTDIKNSSRSIYLLSFGQQVKLLLYRMFLISKRDKTLVMMRLVLHVVFGTIFGFIYKDTGNDASKFLDNYRYIMTTVVFQLYMAYFSLQTAIPLEFPILKRENFNRWYSTSAYFAAQTLGDLPVMFLCSTSYSSISFWMTNQPREIHRYLNFSSVMLAMCYASQGLGIVGSALLEVKSATIVGGFGLAPFFVFSSALLIKGHSHSFFHWIYDVNFFDNAIKGSVQAIYGGNRSKMPCDEDVIFCPFRYPIKVIELTEAFSSVERSLAVIVAYAIFFRLIAFMFVRYRIKNKH